MPGGRLDRDAAGVEGHALADEHRRLGALAARQPLDREQPRRARRALRDAEQRAHAERAHLVLAEEREFGAGVP
jgi:hypothetical protein